jgi:NADH:ubiquinone oxidoreductase subunit B-like Fe-S oxidoreductase
MIDVLIAGCSSSSSAVVRRIKLKNKKNRHEDNTVKYRLVYSHKDLRMF